MSDKKVKDRVLGAASLLIAAWITYLALQFRATGYDGDPGPKMFPLIGAVILAVCGIALLVAPEKGRSQFMTGAQWLAAGKMFAAYIAIVLGLYFFGFVVTVPIMLFVVTFLLSKLSTKDSSVKRRLAVSAVFGIVGGAVLYVLYIIALGIQMPNGVFWNLFR